MDFAIFFFLFSVLILTNGCLLWFFISKRTHGPGNISQQQKDSFNNLMAYTLELEKLILLTEPKIDEQLLDVNSQIEQVVASLITKISGIHYEIGTLLESLHHSSDNQKTTGQFNNAEIIEKINDEIIEIIESLQFQDRVSQILMLVLTNMDALKNTLTNAQQQGSKREIHMLNIEEMLQRIDMGYETVKHHPAALDPQASTKQVTFLFE